MPIRTTTISSQITGEGRNCNARVSNGTLTVYGPGMMTPERAREFTAAMSQALKPPRLRYGVRQPYQGVVVVAGCSTEFEVRTSGRIWIVQDDNGQDHRSRSLPAALQAGVQAMRTG